MRDLATQFRTWHVAEAPAIEVLRVTWLELERVQLGAAALRPFADTSSTAADALAGVLAVRRVVTSTPLPPAHELTGLKELTEEVDRFVTERPDHSLGAQLRPLVVALRELAVSGSPVAATVADVLCEFGEDADGRPEAVLVVPRRAWVGDVQTWLASEDIDCVDVACPADLRTRPSTHRAAVLVGHPASAFSSAFRPPEVAGREHGWLLSAPPAPNVRLVLTTDAPPLQQDAIWLLPAGAHPMLHLRDDGPHRAAAVPHDWLNKLGAATAPARRTPRPAVAGAEDETQAVEVHLASEHAVFFHTQVGPRPHVVAVDEETGAVALSTAPVSAVTRGVVLAVRVGTAPHQQVVARADAWLHRRRGWSTEKVADARGAAALLKVALRRALVRNGRVALHRQLTQTLTDEYARVLLHDPLDELYIAPQRRDAFDALVTAIGARELTDRFDDLATVRTAHQQAGEEIRRELLALLRDRSWVADVEEEGWAVLQAGELGALLLTVVTERLDEPVSIARSWLGVLVDARGRRVTTLAAKEGTT